MRRAGATLMCLAVLLVPAVGFPATIARLAGTVVDELGRPLAGVTVEISSTSLIGGSQQMLTGVEGAFAFNLLPVGQYTVVANLAGFHGASGEVQVKLGRVASITLRMPSLEFSGEVEVTGEVPLVDATQVNTSLVLGSEYLEKAAVGAAGRDYLEMLAQAPGSAGANDTPLFGQTPGSVSSGFANWVYGSTRGGNTYLVDGIDVSDPSHGTSSIGLTYDAIQEINFSTGGFEAEFGRALGGVVNLVTKSGSNVFSGTIDARYTDQRFTENGDHFDPDLQSIRNESYSATLGGPIRRDRLWFFIAAETGGQESQEEGVHFPSDGSGWRYLAKATWQITDNHRAVFKRSQEEGDLVGSNSSVFVERSASSTETHRSSVWLAELSSVISDALFLTTQLGTAEVYDDIYSSHGEERSGHWNQNTGIYSNAHYWPEFWDRERDQIRADLSWFVNSTGGSHELKTGAELHKLDYEHRWWAAGGGWLLDLLEPAGEQWQDLNNDGYFNSILVRKEPEESAHDPERSSGRVLSFYIQDAWRPHPNLIVKPGIRYDRARYSDRHGVTQMDVGRWQPRLGIAWDVLGDARHVLRASVGRFLDPSMLALSGWASAEGIADYSITLEYLCNTAGLCSVDDVPPYFGDPDFFTNEEGNEYVLFQWLAQETGGQTVDQLGVGHLEAPYADQLIFSYETQLAARTSLELSYVSKHSKALFDDTFNCNTWVWGAGPEPDLDDQSTWPVQSECTSGVFANIPGNERKYSAYIAKIEAGRKNFHLIASYTLSDSRGNSLTGPNMVFSVDTDAYPAQWVNRYGRLPDYRRDLLKLSGYFLLPHRVTLGLNGYYASTGTQSVIALCQSPEEAVANPNAAAQLNELGVEPSHFNYCYDGEGNLWIDYYTLLRPRGDLETRSSWQIDLQIDKAFRLGSVDLRAILAIYNIFDREDAKTYNELALNVMTDEVGQPILDVNGNAVLWPVGLPLSYSKPRRYEIGLRIEF